MMSTRLVACSLLPDCRDFSIETVCDRQPLGWAWRWRQLYPCEPGLFLPPLHAAVGNAGLQLLQWVSRVNQIDVRSTRLSSDKWDRIQASKARPVSTTLCCVACAWTHSEWWQLPDGSSPATPGL